MGNQYKFGLDILNDVLFRATEPTSGSDYIDAAKRYIWRAYLEVLRMRPFLSAIKSPPGILNTVGKETGTATATEGSTSVTLDATIATTMVDRKFQIDNEGVPYRITAHTAGTAAITLDATYKQDDASSLAFTIFQDEYDLSSDVLVPWRFWNRNYRDYIVYPENSQHMAEHYSNKELSTSVGNVWRIAMITDQRVRILPWTEDAETLEYDYTPIPDELDYSGSGTGDTPIVGLYERPLIADKALAFVLFDKNDSRYNVLDNIIDDEANALSDLHHQRSKGHMSPRRWGGINSKRGSSGGGGRWLG